jgi:Mn2+/Fe2+ NRAMP family transporter
MQLKDQRKHSARTGAGLGAAFLMATSAIGPGFLTQTTVFTAQLLSSFGFVILVSILLDIGAQLNIWRILAVTEKKAQVLANELLPGLGYFLAFLIVLGGLAFNIGNMAGTGLGLNVLTGISPTYGALISCVIALFIFWMKEAGKAMDMVAKVLGMLMIILTVYVAISSHPPMADAIHHTFIPQKIDANAIVTIVGGTVGGYISFAGAHRLLDAGIKGPTALPQVTKSAVTGILITSFMRYVLFLASFGVVATGVILNTTNPPADVFRISAGEIGYRFFGIVMWSAAITSVVGASYTSVSFIQNFHPFISKYYRWVITFFIIFSTIIFVWIGRPVKVLVAVGALNGLILPVALSVILVSSYKTRLVGSYRHPLWMLIAGWIVVVLMVLLCFNTIMNFFAA